MGWPRGQNAIESKIFAKKIGIRGECSTADIFIHVYLSNPLSPMKVVWVHWFQSWPQGGTKEGLPWSVSDLHRMALNVQNYKWDASPLCLWQCLTMISIEKTENIWESM